ncbi:MAG: hypothetical protein K9M45_06305, partial [Kiritimatiellales bacterium]|nr:hypothetical protein [Kiritimatiellales bacterium]
MATAKKKAVPKKTASKKAGKTAKKAPAKKAVKQEAEKASAKTVKKPVSKKSTAKKTTAKESVIIPKSKAVKAAAVNSPKKKKGNAQVMESQSAISLMEREERNERIKELMVLAAEHGFLTYEDINEAFPEDLVVVEDVEKVVGLLQSMEIEIIRQDDVEEFQARMEKEEADKQSARSDVLDDPVRMYLKQMGQVPLLTREQEVEISKRIEEAEIATTTSFNRVGCAADAYLGVIKRLEEGKERFDRIISDKHVECREDYFKVLPRVLQGIDRNSELKLKYFKAYTKAKKGSSEETKSRKLFEQAQQRLSDYFKQLYFKQKAIEDIVPEVDKHYYKVKEICAEIEKLKKTRSKSAATHLRETRKELRELEYYLQIEHQHFIADHKDLRVWLRKGLKAKTEMIEANLRL